MTVSGSKRIWRSGVRFDCEQCGQLWKDDIDHAPLRAHGCAKCNNDLRLVGLGERMVENARWYRCLKCSALYMDRRGELVETPERAGFLEFTRFD